MKHALTYVSIQHELGMAIGVTLRLQPMLNAFAQVCLRRLGISAVNFHFLKSAEGELVLSAQPGAAFEHFLSIPHNSSAPEAPEFSSPEAGVGSCIRRQVTDEFGLRHLYSFDLGGFGVLTFQRIENEFNSSIVELLKPLISRLALSCQASIEHENLLQAVAARDEAEKTIVFQLLHDDLTRLPNRRSLLRELDSKLQFAEREASFGAVLFLDLDRFKLVNDTLGHAVGDLLLIAVAAQLLELVGANGFVSRLSGDEFIILLGDLGSELDQVKRRLDSLLDRIRGAFSEPMAAGEHLLHVTPSIGIEIFPDGECTADQVLRRADSAMYQAKAQGLNSAVYYDRHLSFELDRRRDIEKELQLALKVGDQFELHYQSQHGSAGECIGAEALLRWRNPFRDDIGPAQFVSIAEESGLMLDLGAWVLRRACLDLREMTRSALPSSFRRLSVNVSAVQFNHRQFVEMLVAIIAETGVDASLLMLELTESTLIGNSDTAIEKMAALRALGIKVAIDDFGTGFSSLSYLSRLPVQSIKIDQTFVRNIDSDSGNRAIVETIVALARTLEIDLIAEGVETQAERAVLENLGCPNFQGFLFGRPVPLRELIAGYR
ncbi:MAG TPA: bifunctional diguanylate cyclase/phosphodiesterase [Dokdonella sp.]|uniref:putative bifunctional diguanylate cyclase/phosphodiesterase n=1 Tax=Dokdonella sp. TaxID=2291710 RepID=UPI002D7FA79E|nr:bifunctional diguanylate cyclase/phosphodiesterase [Dokdonella sp.]HET9033395.1 bifunctional diguanylate cyclase/phosphodiesterase [Dokdonella sp.]